MLRRRSDLQLETDASGRFLPWVVGVMVFLAALALAGALALDRVIAGWHGSIGGRLTVQVLELPDNPLPPRLEAAAKLLRATPGIARADILDRRAVESLLTPWLGAENVGADLPLPGLIDVWLAAPGAVDTRALQTRLEAEVPGARLDDPRPWLDRLVRVGRLLQALGLSVVALIALATVAMVVSAVRAGLAAHREVIEVLHLIGARDSYIASQFQWHVLGLALRGGVPGLIAAAAVLVGLDMAVGAIDAALFAGVGLDAAAWAALAALPVAAVALATLTARLTVLGNLKRMT